MRLRFPKILQIVLVRAPANNAVYVGAGPMRSPIEDTIAGLSAIGGRLSDHLTPTESGALDAAIHLLAANR